MSSYYAFEFSTDTGQETVKDEVKKMAGRGYSVWMDEGKLHGYGNWDGMDWFCNIGYRSGQISESEKLFIRKAVAYLQSIAIGNLVRYWPSTARDTEGLNASPESIGVEDIFDKYPPSMGYNLPCYPLKH